MTTHLPISTPDILHSKTVEREPLKCKTGWNPQSENKPHRVQRKRSKGWRMPPNTVSVCRPGKWGNPFAIGRAARDVPESFIGRTPRDAAEAVALYRALLLEHGLPTGCDLSEIRGKNLACWCPMGAPCHADVLLEFAN